MNYVELVLLINHGLLVRKIISYLLIKFLFYQNLAIRVLDGPVTTLLEARALTMFSPDTHIKSASWG